MASNVFSFYDAAEVAQSEAKVLVNAIGDAHSEESEDYDVRDEADAIVEEDEEERAIDATHSEPRTAAVSGPGTVNQFLDRANALNEIRMLLKEEIEQDSGEYFVCYIHATSCPLFFYTNTVRNHLHYKQPCSLSSTT